MKPIIFNSEGVRAILEGIKNQMRLPIKFRHKNVVDAIKYEYGGYILCGYATSNKRDTNTRVKCPYGQIGSKLWVRETFYQRRFAGREKNLNDILYLDESLTQDKEYIYDYVKKPSVHMPRWASRITLEITDIRVERVQDITLEDIEAEGTPWRYDQFNDRWLDKKCYEDLWNSTYKKKGYGWDTNCWVWVIEFKVIEVGGRK